MLIFGLVFLLMSSYGYGAQQVKTDIKDASYSINYVSTNHSDISLETIVKKSPHYSVWATQKIRWPSCKEADDGYITYTAFIFNPPDHVQQLPDPESVYRRLFDEYAKKSGQ